MYKLAESKTQKAPTFNIINERRMISSNHFSRKQFADVIRKIDIAINFTHKEVDGYEADWYSFVKHELDFHVAIKLSKYGLWMMCYKESYPNERYRKFCKNEREIQAFINQIKKHCR